MRFVGHHVEDEYLPAGFEGAVRALEDVHDGGRGFLVERAEDRGGVVGAGFEFVFVVVAGAAFDARGESGALDVVRGGGRNRREIDGRRAQRRVRPAGENRVRAGSAGEVEEAAFEFAEHRNDALADGHRPPEHGVRERLGARRIAAEMQFRGFDGAARRDEFGEAPPCGIHVAVVADCLREVGGRAGHEGEGRGLGVGIAAGRRFLQKPARDAGVQQEARPARRRAERGGDGVRAGSGGFFKGGEYAGVESREEHGARIERAREIDDFVYGFCRHGEMLANPARPRQKSRR